MAGCFSRNEVVIRTRENGFPGPAVALDGPAKQDRCLITTNADTDTEKRCRRNVVKPGSRRTGRYRSSSTPRSEKEPAPNPNRTRRSPLSAGSDNSVALMSSRRSPSLPSTPRDVADCRVLDVESGFLCTASAMPTN